MRTNILLTAVLVLATCTLLLHAHNATPTTQPADQKRTTPGGVTIEVTKMGEGAKDGDLVFVHYTGKLTDGTQFDSSYDRGEPISIVLGQGRVIRGWEEGLQGMTVGEERTLTIPPNLAYGDKGAGETIPPNATLVFDVELVGLQRRDG